MKIATHPWKPKAGELDNLQTINPDEVIEIEIPIGKHTGKASQSVIYNEYDGAYLMHDDDFAVEPLTKHQLYPLAGECKKHHGSAKGGTQTTAKFLIVADQPFRVRQSFMTQDEDWGTFDAGVEYFYTESEAATK